jgi:hypothetical protein
VLPQQRRSVPRHPQRQQTERYLQRRRRRRRHRLGLAGREAGQGALGAGLTATAWDLPSPLLPHRLGKERRTRSPRLLQRQRGRPRLQGRLWRRSAAPGRQLRGS